LSESLLLDTNVVIWTISSSDRISVRAKRAMSRSGAALFVSVVSVWEIVLKHQAGKLLLQTNLEEIIDHILYRSPWTILPMSAEHLPLLASLPMLHRDPFDRLLIAQARHEQMLMLTPDHDIKKYSGIRTLW
jgi:PIN domain nuclease of toxin-antitoxin system